MANKPIFSCFESCTPCVGSAAFQQQSSGKMLSSLSHGMSCFWGNWGHGLGCLTEFSKDSLLLHLQGFLLFECMWICYMSENYPCFTLFLGLLTFNKQLLGTILSLNDAVLIRFDSQLPAYACVFIAHRSGVVYYTL